jgi:two-component system OmpR family response regulator
MRIDPVAARASICRIGRQARPEPTGPGEADAMRVLVVEDDIQSQAYILAALAEDGHQAEGVGDGEAGLRRASDETFDVLVIDRMLPRLDGLSLVGRLRGAGVATPALFLTALGSVGDRVAGLTGGGDDYLVKPFSIEELMARVNLLGRRAPRPVAPDAALSRHGLVLDRLRRTVSRDGAAIDLKPLEFRLLEHFMLNPEQVLTRAMLLERIWGFTFDPRTNIVETQVCHLRAKIDRDGEPSLISTVRGAGYRLRGD